MELLRTLKVQMAKEWRGIPRTLICIAPPYTSFTSITLQFGFLRFFWSFGKVKKIKKMCLLNLINQLGHLV